jgi:hypothetical protein
VQLLEALDLAEVVSDGPEDLGSVLGLEGALRAQLQLLPHRGRLRGRRLPDGPRLGEVVAKLRGELIRRPAHLDERSEVGLEAGLDAAHLHLELQHLRVPRVQQTVVHVTAVLGFEAVRRHLLGGAKAAHQHVLRLVLDLADPLVDVLGLGVLAL